MKLFTPRPPKKVRQWLALRADYERRFAEEGPPAMPRVLPIERIGRKWYFADDRLRQYRNVMDPGDFIDW